MRSIGLALTLIVAASCGPAAPAANVPTATAAPRTLTLAYADDPSRNALVWAIQNGKVTSATVDLRISFLPVAQIIPAANAKQYDVIEATPLAVPRTAGAEPGFLILALGLVNLNGTQLVTGRTSAIRTPADLAGKTIAVPSLGGTFVQETRYVLSTRHKLDVDLKTGSVKFAETPPEAVPQLLKDGKLDAAVTTQLGLYRLKDSPDHRVLSEIAADFRSLTGQPSLSSVVVTYRDRAASNAAALAEVQRMLRESREYLRRNQADVIRAVAQEKKVDEAYLGWFFTAYDLGGGPLSSEDLARITATWEAAKALGDVKTLPSVADVLFHAP